MLKMLTIVEENIFQCIKIFKGDQKWFLVIRFQCEKHPGRQGRFSKELDGFATA